MGGRVTRCPYSTTPTCPLGREAGTTYGRMTLSEDAMEDQTVKIELPESLLLATGQSRSEFEAEARLLLLAKMFELGRVSSGRAAEICGLSRVEFLLSAGRLGISVAQQDEDELRRELEDG